MDSFFNTKKQEVEEKSSRHEYTPVDAEVSLLDIADEMREQRTG